MKRLILLLTALLSISVATAKSPVSLAQALPWYPDEFHDGLRDYGRFEQIEERRRLAPRKVELEVREVPFDPPVSLANLDGAGKGLLVIESASAVLRRYDLGNGKAKGEPVTLKEIPSAFFTSGPWWILARADTGRIELRRESSPAEGVSWTAPADEQVVAVGIAANQPAAPLLVLTGIRSKWDQNAPGAALRLHALDTRQLRPTKWTPADATGFARCNAFFEGLLMRRNILQLHVSADGRNVLVPGGRWNFQSGERIGVEECGVSSKWLSTSTGTLEFHHHRWIVAQKGGGITGPEGPDLSASKVLEHHWVASSDEIIVAGADESSISRGRRPVVALVDAVTLSPITVISGIGDFDNSHESQLRVPNLDRYFHAVGADKLVVISPTGNCMRIVDLPLDRLRREIPYRNKPAFIEIPPSGQIEVPLPGGGGFKGCQWELVDPPEGTRLANGTLVWRKPPNLTINRHPICFEIDAVFPNTQRIRVTLLGYRPQNADEP